MAKLYFNYPRSTMNADKSTLLLQASYNYRERGMRTYMMTARHDDRAGQGKLPAASESARTRNCSVQVTTSSRWSGSGSVWSA